MTPPHPTPRKASAGAQLRHAITRRLSVRPPKPTTRRAPRFAALPAPLPVRGVLFPNPRPVVRLVPKPTASGPVGHAQALPMTENTIIMILIPNFTLLITPSVSEVRWQISESRAHV